MASTFQQLAKLVEFGPNSFCADCENTLTAETAWLHTDFHVCICVGCASIHRNVGTGRCEPFTSQELQEDDVVDLAGTGNAMFNRENEAGISPDFVRPSPADGDAMEQFVHQKYLDRRFHIPQPLSPPVGSSFRSGPWVMATAIDSSGGNLQISDGESFKRARAKSAVEEESIADAVGVSLFRPDSSTPVLCILVVAFDELKGNVVEWSYPPVEILPPEFEHVPFLALPDGAHAGEEDQTFFVLPPRSSAHACMSFGVSCFRQQADDSHARGHVQKAVCVALRFPLWGSVAVRLQAASRAYFVQNDFQDYQVLVDTYNGLNSILTKPISDEDVHVGLSPTSLILRFKRGVMLLLKSIVLERRVIISGVPAINAVGDVLSLVSLLPGQLEEWLPSNTVSSPALTVFGTSSHPYRRDAKPHEASLLQPYMAVSQLPELRTLAGEDDGFLIGASNALFAYESMVEVLGVVGDKCRVDVKRRGLTTILSLTTADIEFIDWLVLNVERHGETADWMGSDSWVRAQFHQYFYALRQAALTVAASGKDTFNGQGYGELFLGAWRRTRNFKHFVGDGIEMEVIVDGKRTVPIHPGREITLGDNMKVQFAPAIEVAGRIRSQADHQLRVLGHSLDKTFSTVSTALGEFGDKVKEMGKSDGESARPQKSIFATISSSIDGMFQRSSARSPVTPIDEAPVLVEAPVVETAEPETAEPETVEPETEPELPVQPVPTPDATWAPPAEVDPSAFVIDDESDGKSDDEEEEDGEDDMDMLRRALQ